MRLKGVTRYFGGKGSPGTYQTIINCMRPHDTYIEAFLGAGSVLRNKKPAARTIGNDLNKDLLATWKESFPGMDLRNISALDLLKALEWEKLGRVVLYLDPPYPHESRKSKTRYKFELSDAQHVELCQIIKSLPANVDVILSTFPNKIYEQELEGWHVIDFWSQKSRGRMLERLYLNYSEVTELHDYTYAGTNYRERDRIKKKVRRWVENIRELPPHERLAIFKAIAELPEFSAVITDPALAIAS